MDSKLIGSNIARQSRYELIHTTLVKFLKTCTLSDLSPELEEWAKEYLKEDSSKTVYRSDSDTLQSNLARIGNFIMEMLVAFPVTSPAHDLLQRLFDEQYVIMDGKAVLRDKKEVKADSLQNPNDPDATYRAKNDQKVQGYVTNITETVEEGKPNIITSVKELHHRPPRRHGFARNDSRQLARLHRCGCQPQRVAEDGGTMINAGLSNQLNPAFPLVCSARAYRK